MCTTSLPPRPNPGADPVVETTSHHVPESYSNPAPSGTTMELDHDRGEDEQNNYLKIKYDIKTINTIKNTIKTI